MLAVVDWLRNNDDTAEHHAEYEFHAIAPETGPLAEALASREIPIHSLVTHELTKSSDASQNHQQRLPRHTILQNLSDCLQRLQPDLLHANSLSMGRLAGALGDHFFARRTAHLRDIIRLSKAAICDLNRNDQLIAVSHATLQFHVAQGVDSQRVQTVYNGVDLQKFQPRSRIGFLRTELGLPNNALIALSIGQIGLRKGHDLLLKAVTELNKQSSPQTFERLHYVLIGARNSIKPESIVYEQQVLQQWTGSDSGHYLGVRDDVASLMNDADFLIHPAHQEPLGRVLLEAAASGLPVIATDVGGTSEIFQNGISARLVPPKNETLLAEAINEFCQHSNRRQQFAKAARKQCESQFPIQQAAQNVTTIWNTARQ